MVKGTWRKRAKVCGAQKEDVALLQLRVSRHHLAINALVVIVDRHCQDLLCPFLTHHILIQDTFDLYGLGDSR